ncbi:hypothetical protein [Methylocystis echinoides]|uniref:DUF2065 domain-containing protein n=1 Tax=Methylocystis echinoides TaxID=29468 RepID=A0A9W6GUB1_9HYPH|nr:hypothetical protein [Methylocystis echinoides]GLI93191.1 hypothetical protein LMG27198_21830 [Methylocystis echinoides]
MSPTTLYLAKLMGAYSLFAAAWLMWRREAALGLVDRISNDPVFESMIGTLRLSVGLAIVLGHNRWGGVLEALVSLVGWIALMSGIATMFLPTGTLRRAIVWMRFREKLSLYALISSLLGAALFIGGVTA